MHKLSFMKFLKYVIVFTLVLLIMLSCARRGAPSGGPKDEDAPITIKTIPEFKTVNFNENEITIYFDEYIKLNELNKNLIISPPLKYPADITPLGIPSKRLTIKIKDTLLKNTTYTFNFGESIVDNNEGNILKGFQYIFSTGNYIDSLSVKGSLSNAFSKEVDKYVSILLYEANESFNDSTIYKEKPLYVTNTLDSIGWEINNLKKGKYHLIAIKDANNDFLFNPKTDKIAFIDSVISIPTEKEFKLNLFKEELKFKSHKPVEIAKGHLIFGFEGNAKAFKVKEDVKKSGINFITSKQFFEKKYDTLNYYFSSDKAIDSLFFDIENSDYKTTEIIKLRNKITDSLIVKSSIRGTLHFNDTVKIITNNPLSKFDKKMFSLFNKDTLAVEFTLKHNENRNLLMLFDKKESEQYKIKILPNGITDFFNQQNKDTISYNLRTKKKENYGTISLTVNKNKGVSIIVELLDLKEKLIDRQYLKTENKVNFDLLSPKKYLVRIIIDANKNSKWDTGNYFKKNQPEKVIYFSKEIEVKENWFVNETIEAR